MQTAQVLKAADIARRREYTVINRHGVGISAAIQMIDESPSGYGYVIDRGRRFVGVVSLDSLRAARQSSSSSSLEQAIIPGVTAIGHDTGLQDLICTVADAPCPLPVLDEQRCYQGVISKSILLQALDQGGKM